MWQAIARVWPALAGAVALLTASDATCPIYWVWEGENADGDDATVDDILADVDEMINRAATPLGGDDYAVFVDRLGPLPGGEKGVRVMFPEFEETLRRRPILESHVLTGNRWRDWKRGDGKERLRQVLEGTQPTPDAPVTVILPVVEGAVMAHIFLK